MCNKRQFGLGILLALLLFASFGYFIPQQAKAIGNAAKPSFDSNTATLSIPAGTQSAVEIYNAGAKDHANDLVNVVFEGDVVISDTNALEANYRGLFSDCSYLYSVTVKGNISFSETQPVLYRCFAGCTNLYEINMQAWKTEKVISFAYMFKNCSSLRELNLTDVNMSASQTVSYMFSGCTSLLNLTMPSGGFGTFQQITIPAEKSMGGMESVFDGCKVLLALDASNFHTSYATSFANMFYGCSLLQSIDLSSFDTSQADNIMFMFVDCMSLQALDFSSFTTSQMTNMASVFDNCVSLQTLDISSFDTSSFVWPDLISEKTFMRNCSPRTIYVSQSFVSSSEEMEFTRGTYNVYATKDHVGTPLATTTFSNQAGEINTFFSNYPSALCLYADNAKQVKFTADSWVPGYDYSWNGSNEVTTESVPNGYLTFPSVPRIVDSVRLIDYSESFDMYSPTFFNREDGKVTPDDSVTNPSYVDYMQPYETMNIICCAGKGVFERSQRPVTKSSFSSTRPLTEELFNNSIGPVSKTDAEFLYWEDEAGDKVTFPFQPTPDNKVFMAVWKDNPKIVSLTFKANEGTFPSTGLDTMVITDQEEGKVITPEQPVRAGFSFAGWLNESDGTVYEASITVPGAPTTYKAQWENPSPGPDPTPALTDGWHQSDAGWQYVVDGEYVTGWLWIDDDFGAHWYYFNADTYMAANQWMWDEVNSSWYWLCPSGPMIRGLWQWIDNEWYGFWWDGKMCRGWVWDNAWQAWFYCYNNGIMARSTWEGPYWLNWQGIWIR